MCHFADADHLKLLQTQLMLRSSGSNAVFASEQDFAPGSAIRRIDQEARVTALSLLPWFHRSKEKASPEAVTWMEWDEHSFCMGRDHGMQLCFIDRCVLRSIPINMSPFRTSFRKANQYIGHIS